MKWIGFAIGLGALAAGPALAAEVFYRSTMPDGKVVFGVKPEPGAAQVIAIGVPPGMTKEQAVPPQRTDVLQGAPRRYGEGAPPPPR